MDKFINKKSLTSQTGFQYFHIGHFPDCAPIIDTQDSYLGFVRMMFTNIWNEGWRKKKGV